MPQLDNVDTTDEKRATALHLASLFGHEATVMILLQAGANSNHKAKNDLTPVHVACIKGHKNIAMHLISYGAHIPDTVPKMKNPEHQAAINSALREWQTDLRKRQTKRRDAVFYFQIIY